MTYANLGLVINIARKYRKLGVEFEDLIQEGCSALSYAIGRYDPNHEAGAKFSSYAYPVIRGKILDCITKNTGGGRFNKYEIGKVLKLRKEESKFFKENGRNPSTEELAERLGVKASTAKKYSDISNELFMNSLDRKTAFNKDNLTLGDRIEDTRYRYQEEMVTDYDAQEIIKDEFVILAMYNLTPREKEVVFHKRGLFGKQKETYQEISKRLGVNEERVRHIEQRALDKIKRKIKEFGFTRRL